MMPLRLLLCLPFLVSCDLDLPVFSPLDFTSMNTKNSFGFTASSTAIRISKRSILTENKMQSSLDWSREHASFLTRSLKVC